MMKQEEIQTFTWAGKAFQLRISGDERGYEVRLHLGDQRLATYSVDYDVNFYHQMQHGRSAVAKLIDQAKDDLIRGIIQLPT